jgi:hypothetical protein
MRSVSLHLCLSVRLCGFFVCIVLCFLISSSLVFIAPSLFPSLFLLCFRWKTRGQSWVIAKWPVRKRAPKQKPKMLSVFAFVLCCVCLSPPLPLFFLLSHSFVSFSASSFSFCFLSVLFCSLL